ncbi:MAG: hypothetical protein IJT44_03430 [Clostridia bacterium]|nr:hypothetical protein [Clostridia bacterium]
MTIRDICGYLDAEVLCGAEALDREVHSACGSDMMSDVLAFVKNQAVLLTGLVNAQVVRTALMMDIVCIVFVRSKKPGPEIVAFAEENGLTVLTTDLRMYEACGKLYAAGLKGNGEIHE